MRIDTSSLPPDEAAELERLVDSVSFFDRPSEIGDSPAGGGDHRSYTITVEDRGRTHTVKTSDLAKDPALQRLVEELRAREEA